MLCIQVGNDTVLGRQLTNMFWFLICIQHTYYCFYNSQTLEATLSALLTTLKHQRCMVPQQDVM